MRNTIYALFIAAFVSTAALAQTQLARPNNPAPEAAAAFEVREAWCVTYAEWFVARLPLREDLPPDVRPTQRLENEVTYCKLDPQQYARETVAELKVFEARAS